MRRGIWKKKKKKKKVYETRHLEKKKRLRKSNKAEICLYMHNDLMYLIFRSLPL